MSELIRRQRATAACAFAAAAFCLFTTAQAAEVAATVKVKSLVPANSKSFAPLHVGFNSGVFDAFNVGGMATAPIISVV